MRTSSKPIKPATGQAPNKEKNVPIRQAGIRNIKIRILNPFLLRDWLGYIFISKYLFIILE